MKKNKGFYDKIKINTTKKKNNNCYIYSYLIDFLKDK